jgi:hypothetical protein
MLLHDYEPYPSTESGGTYTRAESSIAKELVWAGFDMVARANNHTGDYGVDGGRLTTRHVAAAGLVQAGFGESLREAREQGRRLHDRQFAHARRRRPSARPSSSKTGSGSSGWAPRRPTTEDILGKFANRRLGRVQAGS